MIDQDSSFLKEHGIMDYSLLLVIESLTSLESSKRRNTICSETHAQAYHIGIIDFLQQWNFDKKMERCFKSLKGSKIEISAIEPNQY